VAERVRTARPDILLVAFGNPKQEKWIAMHGRGLGVPVTIGVGGTLDFIAGEVKRAPLWMQRSGLEWLFRLYQQPGRLWRRYVVDMGGFGYFFIRQWWLLRKRGAPGVILPALQVALIEGAAVLSIIGRADASARALLAERLDEALAASPRVVVDLSAATFLDSSAIGLLVGAAKRARELGGGLRLASVPASILSVLGVLRLHSFFEIDDSVSSALERSGSERAAPGPVQLAVEGWSVLKAPRRMDAETADELTRAGKEALASNGRLIIDLEDTRFLASAGLAVLVKLQREAEGRGGSLRLAALSAESIQVIKIARLDSFLHIYPDVRLASQPEAGAGRGSP
jgi:N-acetylglucosaminyldiphosphoundecaprenol N-acetyl-beta-D-mannosaminyltransferase